MNELETTVIVNNSRSVNRGSQRDEIQGEEMKTRSLGVQPKMHKSGIWKH